MNSTTIILITLGLIFLIVYYSYFFSRSRKMVRQWAEENG